MHMALSTDVFAWVCKFSPQAELVGIDQPQTRGFSDAETAD